MTTKRQRSSPAFRERAVRLVQGHHEPHASQWVTIRSIAEKMGCSAEALQNGVRRSEADTGARQVIEPTRSKLHVGQYDGEKTAVDARDARS